MWSEFRKCQVLADLAAAGGKAVDVLPQEEARRAWQDAITDEIWLAAIAGEEDAGACLEASLTLFEGAVLGVEAVQDLAWLWEDNHRIYEQAAPEMRVALLQAVAWLQRFSHQRFEPEPKRELMLSRSLAEVEALLIPLAKSLSAAGVEAVARAEYGGDVEIHKAGLQKMLAGTDMVYPDPSDRRHPAEVVELVSHVPGQFGHAPCLAIVLLDAVRSGDDCDNAAFRWKLQAEYILQMPERMRAPLVAGFRYLYESNPDWGDFLYPRGRGMTPVPSSVG
ncbi:hypothetical protein TRP8649_00815 [Pelagimonas phthalicica]|uniref:Uncharacterized protein n=1 Tax=Pelagimonas phthalicica TaxID=1037362 RepID=A0A238J7P4_9RHOB|nr:hypothetical protein [Pelagimonas phthalicica]TDS94741.1 hypothetical protein CLV87_1256 [Pelagimonas phthalicica]SMX26730.1 hypothetical protein TRP8649_00815 [Pelagimonas phthalicica]